ncbi:MAG: glucosyl-3-phosphoglycerate synthase [Segniliparus sp.]|uniref:glucosyl-3-phosphoglycerate synthase n=1 Tax=Segniliparus sp. TaxID=2804064 RepID=UPI003F2E2084
MADETEQRETVPTYADPDWSLDELVAAKGGRRVAAVLPALNEEETVGHVIASLDWLRGKLLDDVLVVDGGSEDETVAAARAAGTRVVSTVEALPGVPLAGGKGEALWRSLGVVDSDFVVFIDTDLIDPDPTFASKLLGPLLTESSVHLVKGYYRRPLGSVDPSGGGRVTELVARPMLAALRPGLRTLLQPLAGEYAARTATLRSLEFAPGYGVEIGMVLDVYDRFGAQGLAQVNLGSRAHRNQPLTELAAMSRQIIHTMLTRSGMADSQEPLLVAQPGPSGLELVSRQLRLEGHPPMDEVLPAKS